MGRIRTVKPQFFIHELLNDLEEQFPEQKVMLVYVGLWSQCDNHGVFEWKPRTLKTEIMPWVTYDITKTLETLTENKFIARYECEGKEYGCVLRLEKHQVFSGSEKSDKGTKYPVRVNGAATAPETSEETQHTIPGLDKWEMIESQLTGDIFLDQTCMTNGFNKTKFTEFAIMWTQNKKNTGDYNYPIPRLRSFMIEDFKKENKGTNERQPKKHNSGYVKP